MTYSQFMQFGECVAKVLLPGVFTALVIWSLIPVRKKSDFPKRLILENSRLHNK